MAKCKANEWKCNLFEQTVEEVNVQLVLNLVNL